ncbi:MAG: ribonuclease III [Planctomycetota bacterium]|nr:MAG: ribonuclease III [Planctomycetota bacterium]
MDDFEQCQECLGYHFENIELLERAVTHSSVKSPTRPSNERLEFLGDAILGMIISEHLFTRFPSYDEGDLTKIKSVVVSSPTLARAAQRMGLDSYIAVGKGILKKRVMPRSILANLFEAVIAAIYLDGGMEHARRFVLDSLSDGIEQVLRNQHQRNWKSLLQQYAQKHHAATPTYRVLHEEGPDHLKSFEVVARVNGRVFKPAKGFSKKEAEQNAAREAMAELLADIDRRPESGDQKLET